MVTLNRLSVADLDDSSQQLPEAAEAATPRPAFHRKKVVPKTDSRDVFLNRCSTSVVLHFLCGILSVLFITNTIFYCIKKKTICCKERRTFSLAWCCWSDVIWLFWFLLISPRTRWQLSKTTINNPKIWYRCIFVHLGKYLRWFLSLSFSLNVFPSVQAVLNRSASLLAGPCLPRWCLNHLKHLSCPVGLQDIPVFVQQERGEPWSLSPPLGFQGIEQHLAVALATLPQPGLPPSLKREGSCTRCVVVGSGGILHGSHLGSHIDQYDIIIRYAFLCQVDTKDRLWRLFLNCCDGRHLTGSICVTRLNNAPVHGFERDVGSRTTIRLTYPEGAPHSSNEYRKTSIFAVVVFKSLDLDWLTSVITKQPLVRPHHKILHCTRKGHIAHTSITSHVAMALYYTYTPYISFYFYFSIELLVQNVVLEGSCGSYPPDTRELQDRPPRDYSQDGPSYREIWTEPEKCEFLWMNNLWTLMTVQITKLLSLKIINSQPLGGLFLLCWNGTELMLQTTSQVVFFSSPRTYCQQLVLLEWWWLCRCATRWAWLGLGMTCSTPRPGFIIMRPYAWTQWSLK